MMRHTILALVTIGLLGIGSGCDSDDAFEQQCGDDLVEGTEQCDGLELGGNDCTSVRGDFSGGTLACNTDCTFDTSGCIGGAQCGDGVITGSESCDGSDLDGEDCTSRGFTGGTLACAGDCTFDESGCTAAAVCGNGSVEGSEVCDDGNTNNGDGCSADCQSDENCGNSIVDTAAGEECDDGNTTDGDGCQATCLLPACGDNVLDAGELCDDGNTADGDGCSSDCQSDENCGNGITDLPVGETCDDGNTTAGDGCSDACQLENCGNGNVDPGEACDDGNTVDLDGCSANCLSDETCGNGFTDTLLGEECDDGNNIDGDGCQATCVNPACGDGIVDPGEDCDDGNNIDGDGCQANCVNPACGDSILDPGEACDDGNTTGGDGCSADCLSDETCGNGTLDSLAGEECDDGNNTDGDGCQGNCLLPVCGDSIIDPGEVCDDGNTTDGDGCSASCLSDETCGNGVADLPVGEECDDGNTVSGDGCHDTCEFECDPDLNVLDDGSGANGANGLPDLIMSEISPGNFIELWNTTGGDIALAASTMQFCSPFQYQPLNTLAPGVTVPAGGFAVLPWPAGFTNATAGGGEVILFATGFFGTDTDILDFACWGTGQATSRKLQAEAVGKWVGACAPAISGGSLHRLASTTGTTGVDYDEISPSSPMTCDACLGLGATCGANVDCCSLSCNPGTSQCD